MNWAKDNIWKATEYYHHIFQIPISVFQDNEFVFAIPSNGLEKLAMSIKEKLFSSRMVWHIIRQMRASSMVPLQF